MTEKMKKHIVVIASGWGPKYGGINSFNADFCKALESIIDPDYSVICAVPNADETDRKDAGSHKIELLEIGSDLVDHVANHINNLIKKKYGGEILWWVGHDIYSGGVANYGKKEIGGQSDVFHHMAYWLYSTLKSEDGNRTSMQDKRQREVAENCDLVFALGPLLFDHAKRFKDPSKVIEIIPGLQSIEKGYRSESQFNVIMFGRMNKEDDIIKQGRLGAKAFGKFCKDLMESSDIILNLTLIGLPNDEKEYSKEYAELRSIVKKAAGREINVVPLSYTDDRTELFNKLAEHHACLMLSWHEGFGLVGWEAIAAQVPLIVSKNSGLFRLLDEKHPGLTGLLYPVSVKNTEDDVNEVAHHLRRIEHERTRAFQRAEDLNKALMKIGYTWENAALTFAGYCQIPVRKSITLSSDDWQAGKEVACANGIAVQKSFGRQEACPILINQKDIMSANHQFQALHISDLHIRDDKGNGGDFDRSIVLESLVNRVREDREKGKDGSKNSIDPEIILVTGDIAFHGVAKEYDLAKKFFDDLLKSLDLGNDRIFIVPGNHDVNRTKYRPKDIPAYENMQELNRELINLDYRADLFKGMDDYFSFIENNYPHLQSIDGRLVPFVASYTARCGEKIGLVGLNSAWMCRKPSDREQIAIGEYQIKKAMEALQVKGEADHKICMFHHPLSWLWPEERKICTTYFNNSIVLCGHFHEPGGGYRADFDARLHEFQAGGAYLGSELSCRFQYLTFTWPQEEIRLDFRKFAKNKRKWVVDGETGDDGAKSFPIFWANRRKITGDAPGGTARETLLTGETAGGAAGGATGETAGGAARETAGGAARETAGGAAGGAAGRTAHAGETDASKGTSGEGTVCAGEITTSGETPPDDALGETDPIKETQPEMPSTYIEWLTTNYGHMDADKLQGKGQAIPLHLPEIFIPLYAYPPAYPQAAYPKGKGSGCETRVMEEKQEPVDIEKIIAENDALLIEGQAGSGKTTLLKHLAYSLAQPKQKDLHRDMPDDLPVHDLPDDLPIKDLPNGQHIAVQEKFSHRQDACATGRAGFQPAKTFPDNYNYLNEPDNFLPVLILLKDLEDLFCEQEINHKKNLTAEDILEWYLKNKMGNTLHPSFIESFSKAKKALFLLDGLDEIPQSHRDKVVNAFSDFIIRHKGNRLVLTGRPHGLEGEVVKKYGSQKVKILSLNMEQVSLFIQKWFTWLYPGSMGVGGKNAEAMISEIREHPAIDKLIDNPLMLTAICILYHDGKELPGQRAELYRKFIDNLLYRRFKDPENVHDFLKNLAFRMQTEGTRTVDRSTATDILKGSYKMNPDESDREYARRMEKIFDDIEPRCGLLKYENGEYTFWHLTFQEFLAAHYIVDNCTEYDQAIESYWDQERYKEVVELYIGYLSMENKKWANKIIKQALEHEGISPFLRWRLASRSLVDIHNDRRDEGALCLARKRLLAVIRDVDTDPKTRADAGETLGWLKDHRNLREFVRIEGGSYELEGLGTASLMAFEVAKYPVTNDWFEEFIKADGYKKKDLWTPEGRKWLEYTKAEYPFFWNERKWRCPNLPVVGVSWYEAFAFTQWLTLEMKDGYRYRLPDEREWQAAAAGKNGRKYPWGDTWDKNKCNSEETKMEKTSPVGIFPHGGTQEGVLDLAGNVWEWTLSDYYSKRVLDDYFFDVTIQKWVDEKDWEKVIKALDEKTRQLPVIRGGSWLYGADFCRCAYRDSYGPPVPQVQLCRVSLRQDLNFTLLFFYPFTLLPFFYPFILFPFFSYPFYSRNGTLSLCSS